MKVSLISCSPGLTGPDQLWKEAMSEPTDVRIAVNYAAFFYQGHFDWLCFGDLLVANELHKKEIKNLCTSLPWEFVKRYWTHAELPIFVAWKDLSFSERGPSLDCSYVAAIALAVDMGATELHIWGVDLRGITEYQKILSYAKENGVSVVHRLYDNSLTLKKTWKPAT